MLTPTDTLIFPSASILACKPSLAFSPPQIGIFIILPSFVVHLISKAPTSVMLFLLGSFGKGSKESGTPSLSVSTSLPPTKALIEKSLLSNSFKTPSLSASPAFHSARSANLFSSISANL